MKNIFPEAVFAPYIPATMTQPRKNKRIFTAQFISEIKNDQINPADKKPL